MTELRRSWRRFAFCCGKTDLQSARKMMTDESEFLKTFAVMERNRTCRTPKLTVVEKSNCQNVGQVLCGSVGSSSGRLRQAVPLSISCKRRRQRRPESLAPPVLPQCGQKVRRLASASKVHATQRQKNASQNSHTNTYNASIVFWNKHMTRTSNHALALPYCFSAFSFHCVLMAPICAIGAVSSHDTFADFDFEHVATRLIVQPLATVGCVHLWPFLVSSSPLSLRDMRQTLLKYTNR